MGCSLQEQVGQRDLARMASRQTHTFPRSDGSILGTLRFSPVPARLSCSKQDGQYNHGAVHKLPGGNSLTPTPQVGTQVNSVVQHMPKLIMSNTRSRNHEHRSGSPQEGISFTENGGFTLRWPNRSGGDTAGLPLISSLRAKTLNIHCSFLSRMWMHSWVWMRWHNHGRTRSFMHSRPSA